MLIKHLFILDDDAITTLLMEEVIKEVSFVEKYHVEHNGWQALEVLSQIPSASAFPDVVLVDLKMPEMDGFEFIEHYEQSYFTQHPEASLIVITSSVSERDRQRAIRYKSVSGFLQKPLTAQALEEIARERTRLMN